MIDENNDLFMESLHDFVLMRKMRKRPLTDQQEFRSAMEEKGGKRNEPVRSQDVRVSLAFWTDGDSDRAYPHRNVR